MDSGIRRVQLTAPGLRVWTSSVVVNAGVPQTIGPIAARRRRRARHRQIRAPPGAQVLTGGSFRGITPVTIDLSPGVSHAISVTRAGYAPWTREIFAEAAKESTLDARLAALLVEVRIQGEPADAEVFVNGNSQGKAPASLSLPASRHHIEVRREGYNPYVTDVALAPGNRAHPRLQAGESERHRGQLATEARDEVGRPHDHRRGWRVPGGH
jgi:hypothetical protein